LASSPSVCIIGAGAAGLAAAVHLTRRGVTDVTVLEAEHPAAGSSGLSVGVIETQYVEPLDIELRVRAMGFFNDLATNHGLDIVRCGYLRLAHSEHEAESFAASVECQRGLGVADARVVDAREISELAPDMRVDDVHAGLWGPSDGFIDGHLYCSLLTELAESAGARVLSRNRLLEAGRTAEGGHVLRTERGEYTCDYVVNAAGAWASRVADLLGARMPISPQRHEAVVVHLPVPLQYVMPMVMDYTPRSGENGLYFRHERPGQMIAGLHSEEAIEEVSNPDAYARSATPDFVEGVADKLASRLPSLSDAGLAHGWAGLYPVSPDGVPQVGPSPGADGVISAGGAGGSGIQLSPVIGELVADWILDGEPRAVSAGPSLAPARASLAAAPATA
jgi:sarcosine oxidase subunit beta